MFVQLLWKLHAEGVYKPLVLLWPNCLWYKSFSEKSKILPFCNSSFVSCSSAYN